MTYYIRLSAIFTLTSLLLFGCASTVVDKSGLPLVTYKKVNNEVRNTWNQLQLKQFKSLWLEASGPDGDPYTAGYAASQIALITQDFKWSKEAIRLLDEAQEQMPKSGLVTATLGSSYMLAARDFSLRPFWSVVSYMQSLNFMRFYYMWKGTSLLNTAVEKEPKNPITRIIRAAIFISSPFSAQNTAKKDLKLLLKWLKKPALNPDYANILKSANWQGTFYSTYADYLIKSGSKRRALFYLKKLKKIVPSPERKALVSQRILLLKKRL